MSDHLPKDERFAWPTSKGDPIFPVWSYGGKTGMYQAEALRMFAHDLVETIKELELPVREAMKCASGDGLNAIAYCRMMQKRLDAMTKERDQYKQAAAENLQRVVDLQADRDRIEAERNEFANMIAGVSA